MSQAGSAGNPTSVGIANAAGAGAAATKGDVPCDVAAVLKSHCVACHGNVQRQGAPLRLVAAADFEHQVGTQTIGMAALLRAQDNMRPMPPPPGVRLDATELAALTRWVSTGAPADPAGCLVDDTVPSASGAAGSGVVVVNGAAGAGSTQGPGVAQTEIADWAMFGADLANTRDNTGEKMLSPTNVAMLHEAWTFKGPSTTSAPAIVDGVVYLPGWDGKVYARKLADGTEVWTTTLPHLIDSSPSVTKTQVIVADDHGSVHALDRSTGKLQWSQVVDPHEEAHLWSSPQYIPSAGLIVLGVASGEEQVMKSTYTFRGSVVGLDAATGKERWRFVTAPDAKGSGPGVGVWAAAAVDEKRKLLFIGTGNNYQAPDSPYTDSLLAILYETGELAWFKQFTAKDVFTIYGMVGSDFDVGATANLFSIDGADFVGIGVKNGVYYVLDRESGSVKWMTTISPGSSLGGIISSPAYANGHIFVASNDRTNGVGLGGGGDKTVVAGLDARDGKILWRYETPNLTYGGLAHANGLVFGGTTAGALFALDSATGKALWTAKTPDSQPMAGSPTISRGKLIVPWGYSWTLRQGMPGTGGMTVYSP